GMDLVSRIGTTLQYPSIDKANTANLMVGWSRWTGLAAQPITTVLLLDWRLNVLGIVSRFFAFARSTAVREWRNLWLWAFNPIGAVGRDTAGDTAAVARQRIDVSLKFRKRHRKRLEHIHRYGCYATNRTYPPSYR